MDFSQSPFLVIWETTRACDLACVHCRASADPNPAPDELNHEEALHLIDEVQAVGSPILIFSGGDCLKREDLCELITYAKSKGLRTGAIPAVTPALTEQHLLNLKAAGLDQVAFSLDAGNAADHDAFRQINGVFDHTIECIQIANRIGLRTQLNSLINVHNEGQIEGLFEILDAFDIVFWEIFFLVPTGRGEAVPLMSADKFEETFKKIYDYSQGVEFIIKITEAPHYRRYCMERAMLNDTASGSPQGRPRVLPDDQGRAHHGRGNIGRAPSGVNSGKGFTFISYRGEIMPSGFLPIAAGNIRKDSLATVYRESALFRELRDISLLKGRCGQCAYKETCGGSRARAYALSGDYLEEDPCCNHQPAMTCEQGGGL